MRSNGREIFSDYPDSAAALGAIESSMTHISGFERSQILLLPEAVDDYVGADNPVRFVDELDLSAAGFVRVAAKATGRPGYAPADLLKLYIYGYLNRVRSSRRLEMESHRNIEVIEHVFGDQKNGMGAGIVRTIGIVRARCKIGMTNLVYNMRRFACLERIVAAAA